MNARVMRGARRSIMLVASAGALAGACLVRPVVPGEPVTKTSFTADVQTQAVDKLDILFAIDNSASMGDKQDFLEQAIPDLIKRLVNPNCLDASGAAQGSSDNGVCPSGQSVEFPPVHDMHLGIVSSALGPRLGDKYKDGSGGVCDPSGKTSIASQDFPDHNDDHGYLLTRSSQPDLSGGPPTPASLAESALADAPDGFLTWAPGSGDAGAAQDSTKLQDDFQDLVAGVHQFGCGIESQLESWYRFLVQPDPYATLALDSNQRAQWVGVDTTILRQRKQFLRPDSLVAVIVLTDENDSEIDVRSFGGAGYWFMSREYFPSHGTTICQTNPADPACKPCEAGSTDPACATVYQSPNDWGFDMNLRHVHMKEKYGLDPQFPIARYVTGLTSATIPDRVGEYPAGASSYVGNNDCTNPLFAASLPDPATLSASIATAISSSDARTLCDLPKGARSKNLVFYGIIGGVPHELLNIDPNTGVSTLGASDWTKILGTSPETFDYTGIDPHMVESSMPRNGTALDPNHVLAPPDAGDGTDKVNGREWITDVGQHSGFNVDREYACTFQLPTPRDCSNPDNALACDCAVADGGTPLTHEQTPSVCDPANVTSQTHAKAYPTIRELLVAKTMGSQGIAASICPIDVTDQSPSKSTDPLFGYRPAVASIVNRLKGALTSACLPQKLAPHADGSVQCLVLATLPETGDESKCTGPGLSVPEADILATFRKTAEAGYQANGGAGSGAIDPATAPICQVAQVLPTDFVDGSCKGTTSQSGWCYVTGAAAGTCAQSLLFTSKALPAGAKVSLQCIEPASLDGGI